MLPPPVRCLAKSSNSTHAHWVVGKCRPFRNDIALMKLSTFTNHRCARADFEDSAKQCNGGGSSEKDLYTSNKLTDLTVKSIQFSSGIKPGPRTWDTGSPALMKIDSNHLAPSQPHERSQVRFLQKAGQSSCVVNKTKTLSVSLPTWSILYGHFTWSILYGHFKTVT
jgi:hypothetical protein